MKTLAALVCLLCLISFPALAQGPVMFDPDSITEVVAAGPSWDTFTNLDGTGLYHEILNEVFALKGIKVRREYVPSFRAYDMVRAGLADFMTCHDRPVEGLVLARYPMYEGTYYVFFERERFSPWQGEQSLQGRVVAARIGYYAPENFPVEVTLKEVKTSTSALAMVVLGRADFYVDDLNFIQDSMANSPVPFDPERFAVEPIGRRSYYPVFAPTERGYVVRSIFDQGMEVLHRSGRLREIFEKWGHPYPDYEAVNRP